MKKYLIIILTILLASIIVEAKAEVDFARLRGIKFESGMFPEDRPFLESSKQTFPALGQLLKDIDSIGYATLPSLADLNLQMLEYCKENGLNDTDDCRYLYEAVLEAPMLSLDYEKTSEYISEWINNVNTYVKDPERRDLWLTYIEFSKTFPLVLDEEKAAQNTYMRGMKIVKENKLPYDELGFSLGLQLLRLAANLHTDLVNEKDIEKLYQHLAKLRSTLWHDQSFADALDTSYFYFLWRRNPSSMYSLSRYTDILEKSKNPLQSSYAMNAKAFHYFSIGDYGEALEVIDRYNETVDSIATTLPPHSIAQRIADAKSARMAILCYSNNMNRFNTELDAIQSWISDKTDSRTNRVVEIIFNNLFNLDNRDIDKKRISEICIRIGNSDPYNNATFCMLSRAQAKLFGLGYYEQAMELSEEIFDCVCADPINFDYALNINYWLSIAQQYVSINKFDDAIEVLEGVTPRLEKEKHYDLMLDVYAIIARCYVLMQDNSNSRVYAQKYLDARHLSAWPMYLKNNDFLIKEIIISGNEDYDKIISDLSNLRNIARELNKKGIEASLSSEIAVVCSSRSTDVKSIARAREEFECAFSIYTELKDTPSLITLAANFLSFLNDTGDYKRHDEVITSIINLVETSNQTPTVDYIRMMSNEISLASNSGNILKAAYYVTKIYAIFSQFKDIFNNDELFKTHIWCIFFPHLMDYYCLMARVYNSIPPDQTAKFAEINNFDIETINREIKYTKFGYKSFFNEEDAIYCNILLSEAKWRTINKEYDEADSLLNSIAMKPITRWSQNEISDFSPGLRLEIAIGRKDFSEAMRIITLPRNLLLFNLSQNGSLNVSDLTGLHLSLENILFQNGRYDDAMEVAKQRYSLVREFITGQYASLSVSDRSILAYSVANSIDLNTLLSFSNNPDNRILAYSASLFYRNILLESTNMQRDVIYATKDTVIINDYERLHGLNHQISTLVFNDIDTDEEREQKLKIIQDAQELEQSIADRCPALNELTLSRSVTWKDVAKSLDKDEAAIEFIGYNDIDSNNGGHYGALILRKGYKSPEFVSLITQNEFEQCTSSKRTSSKIENGINRIYIFPESGKELYEKLWAPLEGYLKDVKRIYYAPVGSLSTLAFSAIEDSTRTTLCQKYDLRLVSSTAQIVKRKKGTKKDDMRLTLIGDVSYDVDPDKAAQRRGSWRHLDYSIKEISYVDSLASAQRQVISETITGVNASEEHFRSLSGNSPDILLLSTHGFYIDSHKASTHDFYINKSITGAENPNEAIPPLLRGGIVLSDANTVWNNEGYRKDDTDGILTGEEIASLNLSNTKLLVLAACETGLGEPTITEGINGLQRGFKISGVDSMIMSLWVVNDVAGADFIKRFYERLLVNREDRHTAFRNTQLEMMERYPRKPYFWAPFVMLD